MNTVSDLHNATGYYVLIRDSFVHILKLENGKYSSYISPLQKQYMHRSRRHIKCWDSSMPARLATEQEIKHLDACLAAGGYVEPEFYFEGLGKDFTGGDGYYLVSSLYDYIVKASGDGITYCVPQVKLYCKEKGHPISKGWRKSTIKVTKATQEQVNHLEACITAGKFVAPPKPSEYVYEGDILDFKGDGDFQCSIGRLFRLVDGVIECRVWGGGSSSHHVEGPPKINYQVRLKPATIEQSILLDGDNVDSDIIFQGKCCDFDWKPGYYKVIGDDSERVTLTVVRDSGLQSLIHSGIRFYPNQPNWSDLKDNVVVKKMNEEETFWLDRCQVAGALVDRTPITTNAVDPTVCGVSFTGEATEDVLRAKINELTDKLNATQEKVFELNNKLAERKTLKQRFVEMWSNLV